MTPLGVTVPPPAAVAALNGDIDMRPLRRGSVRKSRSIRRFRSQAGRTPYRNVAPPPQRGGYRL